MAKWLKAILTVLMVVFLVRYIVVNWHDLRQLLNLNITEILLLLVLLGLSATFGSCTIITVLKPLGVKLGFWEMFKVHNVAMLLNCVPMKLGTLFNAAYLKKHHNLSYEKFAVFFLYLTLLMMTSACFISLLILITVFGFELNESRILAGALAVIMFGALILLNAQLPIPKGKTRLTAILKRFLEGRKSISSNKITIMKAFFLLSLNFLLSACRLAIIYNSMANSIHPSGYLLLGALGYVILFLSITPGAIGVREVALGFGAAALSVPVHVGLLAAVIDRAAIILYIFMAGGICAFLIWKKDPDSLKGIRSKSDTLP